MGKSIKGKQKCKKISGGSNKGKSIVVGKYSLNNNKQKVPWEAPKQEIKKVKRVKMVIPPQQIEIKERFSAGKIKKSGPVVLTSSKLDVFAPKVETVFSHVDKFDEKHINDFISANTSLPVAPTKPIVTSIASVNRFGGLDVDSDSEDDMKYSIELKTSLLSSM